VAVGVVAVALILAVVLFVRLRRRKRDTITGEDDVSTGMDGTVASGKEDVAMPPELGGMPIKVYELDAETPRVELPAESATDRALPTYAKLANDDKKIELRGHRGPLAAQNRVSPVAENPSAGSSPEGSAAAVVSPLASSPISPPASTPIEVSFPGHVSTYQQPSIGPRADRSEKNSPTPLTSIPWRDDTQVVRSEPSAAELELLLQEEEELERRRETLVKLKDVQDEQAAVRERIKSLRRGSSSR
jgi:hypothetical protein